jgi:4-amino-4-deoxy-L-arabinose transferase-like glycosyltransferase
MLPEKWKWRQVPDMQRTGERLLLAFLIARLSLCLLTVADPDGGVFPDSIGYLGLAQGLLENGRYGVQPDGEADMLHPPAYSSFLALLQWAWGPARANITFMQLAFSGLASWLLVLAGRRFGKPSAGLIAGWLYALSPNVAVWSLTVMSEVSFSLALLLLILLAATSKAPPLIWASGAGALLGLLAYHRTVAMALMPVWAAIAVWSLWSSQGKRKAVAAGSLVLVTGALVVLPWAYRNWATYGQFTFSTGMSRSMIAFNLAEVVARAEGTSRNRAVATLNPALGAPRLTLQVLQKYPAPFLKAQVLGVARSIVGVDIGTWGNVLGHDTWTGLGLLSGAFWGSLDEGGLGLGSASDPSYWTRTGLLIYSLLHSGVLIFLAAIGILGHRSESRAERLFVALALSSTAVLLLLPGAVGNARFRVPAEPYLAMLAGFGGLIVAQRLRAWRSRQTAIGQSAAQERG